jgi:hypothetical protein
MAACHPHHPKVAPNSRTALNPPQNKIIKSEDPQEMSLSRMDPLRTTNKDPNIKTNHSSHTMVLNRAKKKDHPQLDAMIRLKAARLPLTRALRLTSRGESPEILLTLYAVAET